MRKAGYPNHFYGKTWMLWAQVLVLVPITCLACIMGPLFLCDAIHTADGRPGHEAGIPLTITGLILVPITVILVFHLFARQWPIIRIFREGLEIREIGTRVQIDPILNIFGLRLFLFTFVILWQLGTLRLLRVRTTRLRWEEIMSIASDRVILEIIGIPIRETSFPNSATMDSPTCIFAYDGNSLGVPPDYAGAILYDLFHHPEKRHLLQSWESDKTAHQEQFDAESH